MDWTGLVVSLAVSLALLSVFVALIYRFTARFAIGDRVSWKSALLAGFVGVYVAWGTLAALLMLMFASGIVLGWWALAPTIIALALAAGINRAFLRRTDGRSVTVVEASRLLLAPVIVLTLLMVLFYRPPGR